MKRRMCTDIQRSDNCSLVSSNRSKIMSTVESREWAKFFPAEIQTETESALFIHRLFTVTFSELTAKRRIFSHDHFSSKKLGPLSVSLFTRPNSVSEQRRFDATVFSWVCKHVCSQGTHLSNFADSRRFPSDVGWLPENGHLLRYIEIGRHRPGDVRVLLCVQQWPSRFRQRELFQYGNDR